MAMAPTARETEIDGQPAIVLENAALSLAVLPGLGGHVRSLVDGRTGRELLWRRPGIVPVPQPRGAAYDPIFAGGWDDLFPSDAPCSVSGFDLPDHGEWWSEPAAWELRADGDRVELVLSGEGWATPHRWERGFALEGDRPVVRHRTRIANAGDRAIPYLWRIHPAQPAVAGARIAVPARMVLVEGAWSPGVAGGARAWPLAATPDGGTVDLSLVPPKGPEALLQCYFPELEAGWCALSQPDGTGLGVAFDPAVVDTLTLFLSHGAWGGFETVILEPGVGYPADLSEAAAGRGRLAVLEPGATVEHGMTVVALDGGHGRRVAGISIDGDVAWAPAEDAS